MKRIMFWAVALLHCGLAFGKTSAVIENWSRELILSDTYKLTVREYRRVKIIDEQGYEHAVFHDYYDSFKKIRNVRLTVFDMQDKKIKTLTRLSALDMMFNPLYSVGDARMLVLDPQYRNYPFIVEIEVESTYDGFIGFPIWMPRYDHDLEVLNSEMTLQCDNDFKFKSVEMNGVPKPTVTEEGRRKTVRWSVKNLPAINKHLTYKSLAVQQPKVHLAPEKFMLENSVGEMSSWASFGDWYYTLNQRRNELSETTRKHLDSLRVVHGNDKRGLVKAIYKHMQSNTRYVSIQLGIGGFQAIPALEVERTGYGDCKGLTNYFSAMLNYCYIQSNHVLIYAGGDVPDLIPDFPSSQFNHVFLAVPFEADTLWFECTSQNSPPAHTGTFTDDRFALWVDNKKSKLIRTPVLDDRDTRKETTGSISYDNQGDAELRLSVLQSGIFYEDSEYYLSLTPDRIQRFNYGKFFFKDFQIDSFKFSFPKKDKPLLHLNYTLKVKGLGNALGGKFVMPGQVLPSLEKHIALDFVNKKTEISRAFSLTDSVTVKAPPGFRFSSLPEDAVLSSEYGTFELFFRKVDHESILVRRKAVMIKGTYQNEVFDRFYQLLQKVRNVEQRKIVLLAKT
jgi:hypothetical protein